MAATALKPTDEQLFGKDLALVDGDLGVATSRGFVDFKVISGRPNLRQAILIRLQTDPGDIPMHRDYGSSLNNIASEGITKAKQLAFKFVVSALNGEPRIKKVVSAEFKDTANNAFDLNVAVSLADSEGPLNLVFPGFLK